MGFDLDGLAVLGGMAAHPEDFVGVQAEATKIARTLLARLIKDKAASLPRLRAMAGVLPPGTFAHVTDAMTDAEISTLATRLDKFNVALKAADRLTKATLVADLISGMAEPAAVKPARAEKAPAPDRETRRKASGGVEAAKKVLNSRAMGARKAGKASGA